MDSDVTASRAIIYARYSTERQNEASVADQVRVCTEFADSKGWPVVATHSDEGISGAAVGNRPGVQRVLAELCRGDTLLLMDLTRFARSQDIAPMITRLKHRGVRVIGVKDGFDSNARHARMQAGLSGIMSEEYRAMIADRTHSALQMRAKNGDATGGKAYEDPEIVREIFTRFGAGESMKTIASDLNRRGVPSPGADWKPRARPRGRWQISTLHMMMRNERYIGRLIWNKTQWVKDPDTGTRKKHDRPPSEWIVRECPRLIDDSLWERVQARFRVRRGRGGAPRWLLSGVLECALCGGKMICYGGGQHRYICGTNHSGGDHACPNRSSFPRQVAEQMILAPVLNDLLSPAAIAEGIRALRAEQLAAPKPEIDPHEREVAELQRLIRDGLLSAETAEPAIAAARRRAAERRATSNVISVQAWPSEKVWREAAASMREILIGDDIALAREILRELIGPAICHEAAEGHVAVQLTTRRVLLATGTDGRRYSRTVGGGSASTPGSRSVQCTPPLPIDLPIVIRIPVSTRGPKR
jgi:site-specific DNA recombinase